MDLVIVDGDEVARLLPYGALVDELAAAHRADAPVTRRTVFGPPEADESFLGLPAWLPGEALGVKLVTVFPANLAAGRPSVQAVYVLFDGTHGSPLALIDGTELTYRKTAADSALGARFLARDDAATLLVVGAGGLAPHLVAAHRAVRPSIDRVLVWNRTRPRAAALAGAVGGEVVDDLRAAVGRADVSPRRRWRKRAARRRPVAPSGHPPRPRRRLPPGPPRGRRRRRPGAPRSTSTTGPPR